jgi:hypothetical protein
MFYNNISNIIIIIIIIYNLYSKPPCGSTPVLPGYLLLRHSYTFDKSGRVLHKINLEEQLLIL